MYDRLGIFTRILVSRIYISSSPWGGVLILKKEALFHFADGMVGEAIRVGVLVLLVLVLVLVLVRVGRILEIDLNRRKASFLLRDGKVLRKALFDLDPQTLPNPSKL